jgi:biofilm protein TabA
MPCRNAAPNTSALSRGTGNEMILDRLENAERYFSLHPKFETAFEFLRTLKDQTPRKYALDGDTLYVVVSLEQGKRQDEATLEAHLKYIDIHFSIEGTEHIGWRATTDCDNLKTRYEEEKDFMTFVDLPHVWATLTTGMFVIFFPDDAHAPLVSDDPFRKAVVKIMR